MLLPIYRSKQPNVIHPQAGDHIKADPRCIVSRGNGLALRPPDEPDQKSVLHGLKRRLLLKTPQDEQRRNPLQTLANTMASNATDCLLAPPFPGDVAVVSVDGGPAPSPASRTPPNHRERSRPTDDTRGGRRSRSPSSAAAARGPQDKRRPSSRERAKSPEARKLVLLTQALVAVGPGVTVTPLPAGASGSPGGGAGGSRRGGGGGAKAGVLSLCEGNGPVAVAGYGRLKRMQLRAGQRRMVDSSRAVGWTSGVTCSSEGRRSGGSGGNPSAAVTSFIGPGVVYVQTHSLAGLRRLLLPSGARSSMHGGVSGFRGAGGRLGGGAGASRRMEVGLSLKRGLAKRARAGAKRVLLALAFFSLYVVIYSLATALLLEGREGLVNAPRHAVQVMRSLMKLARRIVTVLIRLGQEELWRKEGGEGEVQGAAREGGFNPTTTTDGPVER